MVEDSLECNLLFCFVTSRLCIFMALLSPVSSLPPVFFCRKGVLLIRCFPCQNTPAPILLWGMSLEQLTLMRVPMLLSITSLQVDFTSCSHLSTHFAKVVLCLYHHQIHLSIRELSLCEYIFQFVILFICLLEALSKGSNDCNPFGLSF